MGGLAEGPPRLARPTFEGEEPERDRGGVCTDIMADRKCSVVIKLGRRDTIKSNVRPGELHRVILNIYLFYGFR